MLDLRKTLLSTSQALQANGIAHALIGGFALAAYGVNRATVDVDFLADGSKKKEILEIMLKSGYQLNHSSDENLQFVGLGFVDILLANRPLSQKMLAEAWFEKNLSVQILQVEDLIGLKIHAYVNDPTREYQDKADIQSLIGKNANLNWNKVKDYADLFNQWPEIEKMKGPTKEPA